ncbi:DNA-binding response regulator [Dictyobacter vulcani]|uniref:DNA-binding response regulator n=1 Tax=Dictyobacter vulcani TaxID=2607529 RepID=A0A5J4KKU9_9CHLR|nr:response regulator transcription factor [Dictyobacter vulcani]GER86779.1 DNA-binding response regulator [Dictyobacter vulcani]
MVRVLIVDDHSLMRRAVREVIEKEVDMQVVAEACNGQEAELQAMETQPDVVLMDVDMPDCTGFEATERVLACSPNSRVVIFTSAHQEQLLFQAIQKGAMGYITKDIEPDALIHAIRCAARNDLCIPGAFATQVLAYLRSSWKVNSVYGGLMSSAVSYRTPRRTIHMSVGGETTLTDASSNLPRPLTDREKQILDLMRKGRKNREIALELAIAESTVHKHVQNIFEKLHARNRTEAIYLTTAEG